MKILLIRFSSIGDIVLTTPVIRCIKRQMDDDVELHMLTRDKFESLSYNNPYIDKTHEYGNSLREVIKELKKEEFDYVVDLQKNSLSRRVCWALGCEHHSFHKLDFKKMLLTTFKINKLPDVHIVDRYFEAVEPLDVKNDSRGLEFYISESNMMQEPDLPEEFRNGFYAVVVGGSYNTKVIPTEKLVEIIEKLDEPVILLGGPGDMQRAKQVADAVGENVWNPVGMLNLEQSAAIIKMSKAVLTSDTGMMHIAAALNKPMVSVWGNTVPEFGMYQLYPKGSTNKLNIVEIKDLKCRPCSKLGYKKCPKGHFKCMKMIDTDKVVSLLKNE
ncbi:MAG: glycosyltransferase family 9 protein [Bacteroidales bacterium]|nr:glycosyltransferase family 9 protein [Bacteroidales bacterium]